MLVVRIKFIRNEVHTTAIQHGSMDSVNSCLLERDRQSVRLDAFNGSRMPWCMVFIQSHLLGRRNK